MNPLAILGLVASLTTDSTQPLQSPANAFAPVGCPYTINFPLPPVITETDGPDGSSDSAADIVVDGYRLAAVCIASSSTGSKQIEDADPKIVHDKIAVLVEALGIRGADIDTSTIPGCYDVQGDLQQQPQPYRVLARYCERASSTFIAEEIFPIGEQPPDTFLSALQAK